jgi:hypothetical protein
MSRRTGLLATEYVVYFDGHRQKPSCPALRTLDPPRDRGGGPRDRDGVQAARLLEPVVVGDPVVVVALVLHQDGQFGGLTGLDQPGGDGEVTAPGVGVDRRVRVGLDAARGRAGYRPFSQTRYDPRLPVNALSDTFVSAPVPVNRPRYQTSP